MFISSFNKVKMSYEEAEKKIVEAIEKLETYCEEKGGDPWETSLWENDTKYHTLKKRYDELSDFLYGLSDQYELGKMMLENGAY